MQPENAVVYLPLVFSPIVKEVVGLFKAFSFYYFSKVCKVCLTVPLKS